MVETSYAGPTLEKIEDVDSEWVLKVMEYLKGSKYLHKKFVVMLIMQCREIFEKADSMVSVNVPDTEEITVCGDIHGQFFDLMNIF